MNDAEVESQRPPTIPIPPPYFAQPSGQKVIAPGRRLAFAF